MDFLNFDEILYQPTDLDDELFLSDIPVSILKESLKSQFEDPIEYRKRDYIQSFITRYEFTKDNIEYMDGEDNDNEVTIYTDDFITCCMQLFDEYLNISFNNIDDLATDEQLELLHIAYRFFIKNLKKNFTNIVINFINTHREELSDELEEKKDVTTRSYANIINDNFDLIVLSNILKIIQLTFEFLLEEEDVDVFFKMCTIDEPVLETEFMKSKYNKLQINGNFIEKYIKMVNTATVIAEIQSKIRSKILKKYSKRKIEKDSDNKGFIMDSENTPEVADESNGE